jgi:DNA modification methylase
VDGKIVDVAENALYYGDNLDVLRRYVKDETVDLVYLDPPFNSNATYSVLFGHADGSKSAAQIQAFEDTWHWDQAAAEEFQEAVKHGGRVAEALVAFQALLGPSTMLAYLSMMAPRLLELRRVLKSTGSLYLHCDPTASHYLKLLLDAVFGPDNFRNEVTWRRTAAKGDARRKFGSIHDTLLVYGKTSATFFEPARRAPDAAYRARFRLDDHDGKGPYRLAPLDSPNPRPNLTYPYKGYPPPAKGWRVSKELMEELDAEGRLAFPKTPTGRIARKHYLAEQEWPTVGDVWTDITPLQASSAERLGYPTQKPLALLERIIESGSRPGDTILDPFCGCGTTIEAAEKLKRRWIGIDLTALAISLIKSRLAASGTADYVVYGEPTTADDAAELAQSDPYGFQWWALGLIGARPAEGRKGADHGIDGRLFFFDDDASPKQVIVSVKAGKVQVSHVRDLVGVLGREKAQIGVLISLNEPTQPMRGEAASAGFYESKLFGQFPRVQLLTVAELLDGHTIKMPNAGNAQGMTVALPPTPQEVHPDQLTLG